MDNNNKYVFFFNFQYNYYVSSLLVHHLPNPKIIYYLF